MNSYRSLLYRSRGAHLSRNLVARVDVPESSLEDEEPDTIPFPGLRPSESPQWPVSLKAFLHLFWLLALATLILSAGGLFSGNFLF